MTGDIEKEREEGVRVEGVRERWWWVSKEKDLSGQQSIFFYLLLMDEFYTYLLDIFGFRFNKFSRLFVTNMDC